MLGYKVMSNGKEVTTTVSSDLGGFFASPEGIQNLYKEAGFTTDIELMLMPFQRYYLDEVSRGHAAPFDVGGFHGRIGTTMRYQEHEKGLGDWLLIKLADALLPKTIEKPRPWSILPIAYKIDAASFVLKKDLYLNVHDDVVEQEFDDYKICATAFNNFSHLAIENGPGSKSASKTNDIIHKLRDQGGKRVVGTYDLVHAVIGLSAGGVPDIARVRKNWVSVLNSMTEAFTRIHLPIGVRVGDSLPILEMIKEKKMLRDLGEIVRERGTSITIENQHSLLFGVWDQNKEIQRLKVIREGLQECGIL